VKRTAKGSLERPGPPAFLLPILVLLVGGAVFAIAYLARERAERQLVATASAEAEPETPLALQPEPPSDEDAPDPLLEKLLAAAAPASASVAALDAAAHALLVRERF
jgi:hypothetical protein